MNGDKDGQAALGLLSGGKLPENSITHVQAVLLVDKRERALFATQCPGSGELPVGRVVGQDWRRLFANFEEVEIHSESKPSTCFFTRRGEQPTAYRVRRWSAQPIPGTHSGTFVLIEAVADPAVVDELIYRERMMALGQIAGGVAHEVNNPLTTVSGWLQILLSETGPEEKRRAPLELMNEEINRIAGIVHHLLSFGRRRRSEEELVRVNRLLDDVLTLVRYQIRNDNIELITELASDLPPVRGAPNQLKQVFLNIIVNARQAMPDGGTLTITTRKIKDDSVEIALSDTGYGMDEEVVEKVFRPFYTTKDERGGSGIGLFLCRNIVKEHGGRLLVSSRAGEGSTFLVILPGARPEEQPEDLSLAEALAAPEDEPSWQAPPPP